MKQKRTVDKKLMKELKTLPCIICRTVPSDPDHVTTKGAGGSDTKENIWPICRKHHVERHQKGIGFMVRTYPECRAWLENAKRFDVLDRIEIAAGKKVCN